MTGDRVPFAVAFKDVSAGNGKVPRSELLESGRLPVVDQGQGLIAGYTNDLSKKCKASGPVIVFGDHTRAVKFVDFPFAMGADGTKVLQSRDGFDPRFAFRYLQSRSIPSAGYSRHFKFLKRIDVPKPSLEDQRRVAEVLELASEIALGADSAITCFRELEQSVFGEMFGDPIMNGGCLPVRPLADWVEVGRPITYGILKPGPDVVDGVPYVRVADIKDRRIDLAGIRRTSRAIDSEYSRSRLNAGDLLISIRGHVGRLATVPPDLQDANITQDSARIRIPDSDVAAYIQATVETESCQRWLARRTKGAAVRGINLGDLRQLPVPVPDDDDVRRFGSWVRCLNQRWDRMRQQAETANELFVSLQHRAFCGEL